MRVLQLVGFFDISGEPISHIFFINTIVEIMNQNLFSNEDKLSTFTR